MPYAVSINAYPDIRAALERALNSTKGIKLRFENNQDLMTFRGRVHSFRCKDRAENRKIYPEDHPMHGRSVFDPLMVKTKSTTEVWVIKLEGQDFQIEELE